jgi:hypothetical protein
VISVPSRDLFIPPDTENARCYTIKESRLEAEAKILSFSRGTRLVYSLLAAACCSAVNTEQLKRTRCLLHPLQS